MFKITEQRRVEFRTEIFESLNHFNPDPATVNRDIPQRELGTIGGGVQGVTTRVIQLGAKLYF